MGLESDLTHLDDLTEDTIRDRLRERYERDLIYVGISCCYIILRVKGLSLVVFAKLTYTRV